MAGLLSLASARFDNTSRVRSSAIIYNLGSNGQREQSSGRRFQYFPDTIQDAKAVVYQQKQIPGGSLPLYQWTASGERVLSFKAYFTTDVDYLAAGDGTAISALKNRVRSLGQDEHNQDIRSAIAWLRSYTLPVYSANAGIGSVLTRAPQRILLSMLGSGIGMAGGDDGATDVDSVPCIMTQCDVSYEAFFETGLPRVASVNLAFAQISQFGGTVQFPQFSDKMRANIVGPSAGVGTNTDFIGYTLTVRAKGG